MKKVLSFVLVLCMILGSFGMAFAAPADVVGKDYEDAVNVLVELGVVAGYKDGSFKPENVVTRAEAATFIVKAMGLADYAVEKSNFSDMAGHWADPFVAYAASLGFVKGNTDGTFAPNATVSSDQMITMLVQALGYKADYLVGGYPGAFVNQAKALGMLKGVKSGATGCTRADVATLLFNTLDKQFVRYTADGQLQGVVDGIPADNMLKRLGAKTYVPTTPYDDTEALYDFIVVGNEESVIDLAQYQGALVTAYANGDDEIIAMKEVASVFITGEYKVEADGTELFVAADKTEYKLKDDAKDAAVEFVNGAVGTTTTLEAVGEEVEMVIAASVSGKYLSEVYSIATWTYDGEGAGEEGYFQMTEEMVEEFAEEETLNGYTFYFNDNDEIEGVVLVGVKSLADIKEDNIVKVYLGTVEGEANKVVKVAVGTEKVEGKITRVSGDETEYTINGKKYEVSLVAGEDALSLGDEGTFFLNASGKIAASEAVSKVENFAIITKTMGEDTVTGAYEATSAVKIKLMTADGKEAVYVVEEEYADSIVDMAVYAAGEVITFSVDKNGEIDEITTKTAIEVGDAQLSKKGFLAGKAIADEVVVFEVDAEDPTDVEYSVATLKDVPVAEDLVGTKYVLNTDGEVVVIVLDAAATATEEGIYGIVVGYDAIEDADGEDIYEVTMLVDGEKETFLTADQTLKSKLDAATTLQALTFADGLLDDIDAARGAEGVGYGAGEVAAVKTNGIDYGFGIEDVAEDVVVYLYDADEEEYSVSKLSAIKEGDYAYLYEVDADEEDGIDYIVFEKAE